MIEEIKYNKEYIELIQAFIPDVDKGCISLEKNNKKLILSLYDEKHSIDFQRTLRTEKHTIKYHIYKLLEKITKKSLKWGTLVGVSPLKLFKSLDKRLGRKGAIHQLRSDYLVDQSKIDLGYRILDYSKNSREKLKGYSIYINIPFCPSKCSYCSYPTYSIDRDLEEKYIKTVLQEIDGLSSVLKYPPTTVYIGGGTPSAITVDHLEKIIDKIQGHYPDIREFTVEIGRPDTVTVELLEMLKSKSIDRISINPQSMNDNTLEKIGRSHSVQDFYSAYDLARTVGFDSINVDLIVGLPGEIGEDFRNSLSQVIELTPENISIHYLAIKKGSEYFEADISRRSHNYSQIRDELVEEKYNPYYLYRQKNTEKDSENIGYTTEDNLCLYNIIMMEDLETVIGIGMGASTKIIDRGITRHMNPRLITSYIETIDQTIQEKKNLIGGHLENK